MAGRMTEGSSPHGVKRKAHDNLESEQRLTKRFDLLNLGASTSDLLLLIVC